MKKKLILFVTILLASQLATAQGLLELRGRYWEVVSFDIKETESKLLDFTYSGGCDSVAMKESSYNNYNEFGGDDAILLADNIVCENEPSLNVIGVSPDRRSPDDTVEVTVAIGEGRVGGLFSREIPEDQRFKFVDLVRMEMKCSLEYRPFYVPSYAYVDCIDPETNSTVRLLAH